MGMSMTFICRKERLVRRKLLIGKEATHLAYRGECCGLHSDLVLSYCRGLRVTLFDVNVL